VRVYLVLAYDLYYPEGDNVEGVFANIEDAEEYLTTLKKTRDRDWEYYKIVEKEMLP
jgi:hypothetical protein